MSLRVRFWGTRGSIPTPGAHTVRYGGNTPCVEVRTEDGALVILDAGTGIRELGRSLLESAKGATISGDIFLSHAHWDHIQGLPFFAPIFQRGNHFTIWSAPALARQVDRVVREQMSPTVFPVAFGDINATIEFRALDDVHAGAGYVVRALPVRHPGGALGYRISNSGAGRGGLVYIADNELGQAGEYEASATSHDTLVEFARGASVLVHDSMYTADEYDRHRGWGHSHYEDVLDFALDAEVERLVLFHHNPVRSDEEIDQRLAECRALAARRAKRLEVVAAAEGLTLTA
jgi:phosphoribosyl 1,2-cyclic phosphodiesterase